MGLLLPVARPRNYLLIICLKFFCEFVANLFYTFSITYDLRKLCTTILCKLYLYFACSPLFGIDCICRSKISAKNKAFFNCSNFRHVKRDYPRMNNRRKDKEKGRTNFSTRSNYDLSEIY